MITKKILEEEIENLMSLSDMVRAYEEIAAGRIKESRDSVLLSRTYMTEINEIFEEVIFSYKKQIEVLMKAKKIKNPEEFSFINRNGRTLYVLISANTGLYGSIVKRTFDLFVGNSRNKDADLAIIGKLGLSMWQQAKINEKYYYFDFPDQSVDEEVLKKILNFLLSFKKVIVFYGRFQNLVEQDATFSDISGNSRIENSEKTPVKENVKFFFEPSLEKILEFFEKQIFSSIFEQTIRESQLAKIASRLTSLNSASEHVYKQLTNVSSQKNRSMHQLQNKKQLQTFASRILWKRI